MNPDSDKLDDLSERIAKAAAKPVITEAPASVGRVGFDFVGSVAGAGIIGAIADHVFGTSPWCLLGMIVVGFGVGMLSVWRSMQKPKDNK